MAETIDNAGNFGAVGDSAASEAELEAAQETLKENATHRILSELAAQDDQAEMKSGKKIAEGYASI